MEKIYVVSDTHCRDFYKDVLNVIDRRVVFLGDYMDPYWHEGFTDEEGIQKLKDIIKYKKSRPNDVTLLIGNHCLSWIWSWMGFERTSIDHYSELHKIYRDNIELFEPCKLIKDTLFVHAGVSKSWLREENRRLERSGSNLIIDENNIVSYIDNEFRLELQYDKATPNGRYPTLKSNIFNIGWARGGGSGVGGPFWSDFNSEFEDPGWNLWQVVGHQQSAQTGIIRQCGNTYCLDSRAVFEYDLDSHKMELSSLTKGYGKN